MPEVQAEAPEFQYPEDADLLALLNMDGSLDLLNSSLFRFKNYSLSSVINFSPCFGRIIKSCHLKQ